MGLPAENFAIKSGRHPREITDESIINFQRQFRAFGLSYDWSREINTADPSYYKWTQWVFLQLYKKGLAYRKKAPVNWCPSCLTVLAKEGIVDEKCERCGTPVTQRNLMQWFFKVTAYADRLDKDCDKLNWEPKYLNIHRKWIGKKVKNGKTTFHVRDWCISRQRYWGPPIPIVYCDKCGEVPDENLPVMLPDNVDYTPTGESPLAKDTNFVFTKCPKCGGSAKREVDTMDTFVSSAWYQFRFTDPFNEQRFASEEALNYWGNVDNYDGTAEHLTAHLIYARFVTKALYDQGYLPFDEPFPKYTTVGVLVDKKGNKFSKRLGNAPDTNSLVEVYGGDLLRMSCQFITPFGDISRWGEQDVVGVRKFRDRIWRIFKEKVDGKEHQMPEEIIQKINQLVKDVEENIEVMRYNVALSKMMVFINEIVGYEGMVDKFIWEIFIKIIAPFAPFMTEEMWHEMGHQGSVHHAEWPKYDQTCTENKMVQITVQENGRVRGFIEVQSGISQMEVEERVKENPKFEKITKDKIIFIPDKVINFVSNS